jgi:hypothetical protein
LTQFSIFFHRKVSFPLSGELFKASFNLNCLAWQGKASPGETGERAFDGAPAFMHLLLLAHLNIWQKTHEQMHIHHICRGRCGHCPWSKKFHVEQFCSTGKLLMVMWNNILLHMTKLFVVWSNFVIADQ